MYLGYWINISWLQFLIFKACCCAFSGTKKKICINKYTSAFITKSTPFSFRRRAGDEATVLPGLSVFKTSDKETWRRGDRGRSEFAVLLLTSYFLLPTSYLLLLPQQYINPGPYLNPSTLSSTSTFLQETRDFRFRPDTGGAGF